MFAAIDTLPQNNRLMPGLNRFCFETGPDRAARADFL
jgi:hypothetical protein